MDKSKVANGIGRCGLLLIGLLGLYLSHNKRIPEYMFYVACYISCIGLGALIQYLVEGDYKESEEKDKVILRNKYLLKACFCFLLIHKS